jgi:hypothetical protein
MCDSIACNNLPIYLQNVTLNYDPLSSHRTILYNGRTHSVKLKGETCLKFLGRLCKKRL